jgi:hypothetical protein
MCSNINFIEMCTNYHRVIRYFKFAPAKQLVSEKLTFYGRILKSTVCVALVLRQGKNFFFFKSCEINKIKELVATSNTLTNSFADLVTSNLGPDVAHGPPALPR